MTRQPSSSGGLPYAVAAYFIWGFLPLFLRLLHGVPPLEFVGWRIIFTVPVCLAVLAARRSLGDLVTVLTNRRLLLLLITSSVLIGGNWLIFVSAVQNGHVFAISLGYYINPLLNVLLGTLFLGEKLGRLQWLAVALAGLGVGLLAVLGSPDDALTMLGIALALALSFAGYGLVRKFTPVVSLTGLAVEVLVLVPAAIILLACASRAPVGLSFGRDSQTSMLLAISGVVTAIPLILFGSATRRLDLSTLGFVQFLSPTIAFLSGLFVFHEALRPGQLACFIVIWTAIAVFCWDLVARRNA